MYTRHLSKGYMSLDLIKVRYACIETGDIPASYVSSPEGTVPAQFWKENKKTVKNNKLRRKIDPKDPVLGEGSSQVASCGRKFTEVDSLPWQFCW